jgi:hypothetical protein
MLFRTVFVGFLGEVEFLDRDEDLADFLTSEGVLSRPKSGVMTHRVSSALIDNWVRLKVIPAQFPNAPTHLAVRIPSDFASYSTSIAGSSQIF